MIHTASYFQFYSNIYLLKNTQYASNSQYHYNLYNYFKIYQKQMLKNLDYESQEDDDYQPTKKQQNEFVQEMEKIKKKPNKKQKVNIHQLWEELKNDTHRKNTMKKIKPNEDVTNLAEQILSRKQIKTQKKVIFAGKQFILDQTTGQLKQVQKQIFIGTKQMTQQQNRYNQRQILQEKYFYLNQVVAMLNSRYKNINSIHKSKMDWKNFVKKEGIQDKLSYNRKGGALEDFKFIKRVQNKG